MNNKSFVYQSIPLITDIVQNSSTWNFKSTALTMEKKKVEEF